MTDKARQIIDREKKERSGVLNLNNCGFTEWPEEIFEMEWLEILTVGDYPYLKAIGDFDTTTDFAEVIEGQQNRLLEIHPLIKNLQKLRVFSIYNNSIKEIKNLSFNTNLQVLGLSKNEISKVENLSALTNLKILYLNDNPIVKIENLENLNNIEDLYISSYQLIDIDFSQYLHKVKYIHFTDVNHILNVVDLKIQNRIQDVIARRMPVLEIRDLKLDNIPESLGSLYWLKELTINYTNITKIEHLEKLVNLEKLTLIGNKIERIEGLQKLKKLKELDLSINNIVKIDGLDDLKNLELLILDYNPIKKIENLECLRKLRHLQIRYVNVNHFFDKSIISGVTSVSDFIGIKNEMNILISVENLANCKLLETLDLSWQNIKYICSIRSLNNLKTIKLSNCNIQDLEDNTLPKSVAYLDLSYNKLNNLNFINSFSNLKYLDISNNSIFELPLLSNLKRLEKIYFHNNPFKNVKYEMFGSDDNQLKNYKVWFKELYYFQRNNFFKICLIGNARAGKSSLLDRLERNTFDPNNISSHGIIIDHSENWTDQDDNSITIQYWDFGGQDLYHGTHKWFLKGDHLNILVWNKNSYEDNDPHNINHTLQYWLSICNRCNSQNKVLITQTKKEIDGLGIPDQFESLKEKYNLINNIIHIDSEPDDPNINNIDTLKAAIKNQLLNSPILSQKIPLSFHKVRTQLINKSKKEVEIDYEEFMSICKGNGVGKFTDFEESCALCLRWLQVSGVVFYNEHILSSRIIIDQKWAINSVYKAFDRKSKLFETITRNKGHFLLSDLYAELEEYSEHEKQRVLDYLQFSYAIFELDYNYYRNPEERSFICPRFLSMTDIELVVRELSLNGINYSLRSDNFNESDFDDFISILGQTRLINNKYLFKNCILLEYNNDRLLLYKNEDGSPELLVGPNCKTLLGKIEYRLSKSGFAYLFDSINEILDGKSFDDSSVKFCDKKLLDEGKGENLDVMPFDDDKKKILDGKSHYDSNSFDDTFVLFISYAHDYQEASNIFVEKINKFFGSATGYKVRTWVDQNIFLGENWHERIQAEIKKSDMSILLLSDDFFNSKYIKDHEMSLFIDQQKETGYPFIPIYFSPCEYKDWEAIKRSQLFKPDASEFEEVNSRDFAFTSLLYKGPTLVVGAENSPNVNRYFKMLRRKLEEIFINLKK